MTTGMGQADHTALRRDGFTRQAQEGFVSARLKTTGGRLDAEQLRIIADVSSRYGKGFAHFTTGQSVSIPFIRQEDAEAVMNELQAAGMRMSAGGPRLRVAAACQGSGLCSGGWIECAALAAAIDGKFAEKELPRQCTIGIAGCRNNCVQAERNDIAVLGGAAPIWIGDGCAFCGQCVSACGHGSIKLDEVNRAVLVDEGTCARCGRCVRRCPAGAWEGRIGYNLTFGGFSDGGGEGTAAVGRLPAMIFSDEALYKVIDATLTFYEANGRPGERFREVAERAGWERLKSELEQAL